MGMSDIIYKPDLYTKGRQYEPLHVMQGWGLIENHCLACAFKYIARCDRTLDYSLYRDRGDFHGYDGIIFCPNVGFFEVNTIFLSQHYV